MDIIQLLTVLSVRSWELGLHEQASNHWDMSLWLAIS